MATYETVGESISVNVSFRDKQKPQFMVIKWKDRVYKNLEYNLGNIFDKGYGPVHTFSVSNHLAVFKIRFDTIQLKWTLISVYWKD